MVAVNLPDSQYACIYLELEWICSELRNHEGSTVAVSKMPALSMIAMLCVNLPAFAYPFPGLIVEQLVLLVSPCHCSKQAVLSFCNPMLTGRDDCVGLLHENPVFQWLPVNMH